MFPSVTIIVCTADRPGKLRALLRSLSALTNPRNISCELVLINNRPGTDIRPILEESSSRMDFPALLHSEARRGISSARNAGIRQSRGEILAFTDDDCIVDPEWLTRIHENFAVDPELMGLGGRVELFDESAGDITVRRGGAPAALTSGSEIFGFLHGCNMAFRRSLFERVGYFDPDFGIGSRVGSGDDCEFVYRAFRSGARVRYQPDVLVYHDHGRRTRRQVRGTLLRYQLANGAVLAKHRRAGDEDAAMLLRAVAHGPLASLSRRPYSISESLRAGYRAAVFGLGALRYRFVTMREPRGTS